MLNLLWVSTTMFLSVILGAVAIALLGVNAPETLSVLFDAGDGVADWIYHLDIISADVRNIVRFLITGPQMVFVFFVIVSRIIMSMLGGAIGAVRG